MQLENLLEMLSGYSSADKEFVLRAYAFAKHAHKGQTRKSGEPYITHPVAVTCILCSTHADRDTLAAGLLHDVVEDCNVPLEVIEETFNKTVANRVNGVTKIGKEELEDPIARRDANLTKILKSINQDICIILIKAADRLHNLLTMEYMDKEKAKAKARETLEVYVPIMSLIGEYKIKNQLEDNAFKYFEPDEYKRIEEMREEYVDKKRNIIEEMILSTTYALHEEECEYDLSLRIKGVPDTLQIHEEIVKLKLDSKFEDRLRNIHRKLCGISKTRNNNIDKSKEGLSLLKEATDILGYNYITDKDIKKSDTLVEIEPFYENDVFFILNEIISILLDQKDKNYSNYLNHPRISFTQNILATSMNQ